MIFRSLLQDDNVSDFVNPKALFVDLFGQKTYSGETVTVESSLSVPTVYSCVNILANSVAVLPFQTFKKTKNSRERDSNHPVAYLLEVRPNPYQSPFKFKHLAETHRNLWGNAYINIEWDAKGFPSALWLLNPAYTEPIIDPKTNLLWYVTSLPNGKRVKIPHEDIIHLTTLSVDGLKGKSPIQIARESIGSSQAAIKFKSKFFANGTASTGFLKIPEQLNKDAKENIRNEWEKMTSGLSNAQRVAILDAGLDYQKIGMPLKDAQFIEGLKFDKAEIATIYNIPLHMVNELDRATFSNIEEQSLNFVKNTLSPILIQWEQGFTYHLFTDLELKRYYNKFNIMGMLRGDSKARSEFYKLMWEIGAFNINKILELEDENGIGELGEKHFVSLNYTTLDLFEEYQKAKSGASKGGGTNE